MDIDFSNPAECPYYLISRVSLVVAGALKRGFVEAGAPQVKPAYINVLLSLWKKDGLQVARLGRRAGLEPSTMTGLLDRMERDGLVTRQADPNDRRAQRIFLTEDGRVIEDSAIKVIKQIINTVFDGISDEALERANDVMRQVLSNANKG